MKYLKNNLQTDTNVFSRRRTQLGRLLLTSLISLSSFGFSSLGSAQTALVDRAPLSGELEMSRAEISKWLDKVPKARDRNERRLDVRREDLQKEVDKVERLELLMNEVSVELTDVTIAPAVYDGSVETVIAVKLTNQTPFEISRPTFKVTYEPMRSQMLKTSKWKDGFPEFIMDAEKNTPIPQGEAAVFHIKVKMSVPEDMSDIPNGDWVPITNSYAGEKGKSYNFSGLEASYERIDDQKEIIEKCETLLGKYDAYIAEAQARIQALYEPNAEADFEKMPSLQCYP